MSAESVYSVWTWLLALSKVQLILLGLGLALIVAISKISRFLFLLGFVLIFLTVLLPEISKRYENSPIAPLVNFLIRQGIEVTQDPQPPPQASRPEAEQPASATPSKEGK